MSRALSRAPSILALAGSLAALSACKPDMETAVAGGPPAVNAAAVAAGVVKKASEPPLSDRVTLAGQILEAPAGFRLQLVQQPPLEKLSAVAADARCDFGVLLGHDSAEDRARLVEAMNQRYPGDKTPYTHKAGGRELAGVEIKASGTRLFSTQLGSDLLAVSYTGVGAARCDPLLARLLDVLGAE